MAAKLIEVLRSPIHGSGVFALRRIAKGREIIRYRGKLLTHEASNDGTPDDGHTFLFILNDHYVIDAGQGGNEARFINHSCQPNCIAYLIESKTKDPRKDRISIESLRDIAPGEELSYDYRIEVEAPITRREARLWACHCGSRRCRGTMLRKKS
jgi:SET domain-containing protein